MERLLRAWYFPLLLTHLLSSVSFGWVTSRVARGWLWIAPVAFGLNALRLAGRMLSMFAGQHWLDAFNGKAYFPVVFVVNALLVVWLVFVAREIDPRLEGQTKV